MDFNLLLVFRAVDVQEISFPEKESRRYSIKL